MRDVSLYMSFSKWDVRFGIFDSAKGKYAAHYYIPGTGLFEITRTTRRCTAAANQFCGIGPAWLGNWKTRILASTLHRTHSSSSLAVYRCACVYSHTVKESLYALFWNARIVPHSSICCSDCDYIIQ